MAVFLITISIILSAFFGQACSVFTQNRQVKFNEAFNLKPKETVKTEDKKLEITLKGVGRTISESGEAEYAELQIKVNNKTQELTINERENSTATVGNYIIKLINAESFGQTHCQLEISRKNE